MFSKISAIALLVGAVAAQSGNPTIAPAVGEIVPACKAYTIKWTPTSTKTLNIQLLRGPSNNIKPIGAPIAQNIPNSGSFVWTPSADLEADTTHYGLNLTENGENGSFQYSPQFGISKADCKDVASSSSSSISGYPTASVKSVYSSASSTPSYNATSIVVSSTSSYVASTGYPVHNSSIVLPTKSMSVPNSLKTTATSAPTTAAPSASSPVSTGAASPLRAGLGLAGAIGAMVFML